LEDGRKQASFPRFGNVGHAACAYGDQA
jgi:hypothetical protein